MKFVLSQPLCPEGMAAIEKKADIFVADRTDVNAFIDEMQDAEAVIIRLASMDAEAIAGCPQLRVIGRPGVGYDSIDVAAATAAGIPVVLTPGTNSRSVAEHTLAMMFAVSKNIVEGHAAVGKGEFFAARSTGRVFELQGKTAAILGVGAIGREVASLCRALGMEVLGYDPFLSREQMEALGCRYYADYEDMLPLCDFLTIHVPLDRKTRGMISKPQLQKMKPTAIVINCARGGIINEQDLAEALEHGTIAGAGIDVYEQEPPAPDNPLLSARHLVCSPHSASMTKEAVVRMAEMCVEGCMAVLEGKKWPYVADKAVYNHPRWAGK